MYGFRSEPHYSHPNSRERMRFHQILPSGSMASLESLSNWGQSLAQNSRLNPDLDLARSIRGENSLNNMSTAVSPGFIGFPSSANLFTSTTVYQDNSGSNLVTKQAQGEEDSNIFVNSQLGMSSSPDGFPLNKIPTSRDSSWNPQLPNDGWMVDYSCHPVCRVSNNNQDCLAEREEVISNNVKAKNISVQKPTSPYGRCLDLHSIAAVRCGEPSKRYSQIGHSDVHFLPSSSGYQNGSGVQNLVTLACSGNQSSGGVCPGSWSGSKDELVLLPSFRDRKSTSDDTWLNQQVENLRHYWGNEIGGVNSSSIDREFRILPSDSGKQGLSLSLSSNPSSTHGSEWLKPMMSADSSDANLSCLFVTPKSSTVNNTTLLGKLGPQVGSAPISHVQCHVGPLGPFTGYATILKSSRFLKPAQELLDEFCHSCCPKFLKESDGLGEIKSEICSLSSIDEDAKEDTEAKGDSNSVVSYNRSGPNEVFTESFKPEFHHREVRLLYLRDEVSRRYKVYHQQIQMVVSSFESVAGLGWTTPYLCLALKRVVKNFRCLRNAIKERLKQISCTVVDDSLSPKCNNNNASRFNGSIRSSFEKQKAYAGAVGFSDPQQHIWRPHQRGLPERAVAVLRAWLFDHFLHPYPTDTDKQMLATQTGLSRNQVSNWFINARVRVWKPMVEEIHMLETCGGKESWANEKRTDGRPSEIARMDRNDSRLVKVERSVNRVKRLHRDNDHHFQASPIGEVDASSMMGFMEKRSRLLDRGVVAGGNVSLTLGLRHGSAESSQQTWCRGSRREDSELRQVGGQQMMIHDHFLP